MKPGPATHAGYVHIPAPVQPSGSQIPLEPVPNQPWLLGSGIGDGLRNFAKCRNGVLPMRACCCSSAAAFTFSAQLADAPAEEL